jgi:hypothetical protein
MAPAYHAAMPPAKRPAGVNSAFTILAEFPGIESLAA